MRESVRSLAVTPLPPADREKTRTPMTRPGAVNRPPPGTTQAVSIPGSRRSQRDQEHPRQEWERSEDRDRPQCERNTRREPRGRHRSRRPRPRDRERKEERERQPRATQCEPALLSSQESRSEERETREDKTRWQDYEVSPKFPRRGTCGEN